MSKYQALIDALKAGPVEAPWFEHHDKGHLWIENQRDDVVCDMGRGSKSSPTSQYIAAANPATISALLADLEAAEKDAERYRALRDGKSQFSVGRQVSVCDEYPRYEEVDWLHESELDAAIDAALSQLKGD